MAVRVVAVGREPVDVAGTDAAPVRIENLGTHPLWFLPAETADQTVPEDRVGHLLEPGERETAEPHGTGFPLWVWSQHPTAIGVGPRLDR